MDYSYEAVVANAGLELFKDAFCDYMESLDFDHMSIGGRLGGRTSHEFRKGDHLLSLTVSGEGQSHFRVVVHSHTLDVEQMVLDALTEGVADFLVPFCKSLTQESFERILGASIQSLRDAFDKVSTGEG